MHYDTPCAQNGCFPCPGHRKGNALCTAQESSSTIARLMEKIVVSASGIEEGLQDAPIAVSAFTGETLDYRNFGRELAGFTAPS